ncbi:MAG: thioredoxin family protein [Flavobacteriaceae bacterium]|nr:thioredoxin family protein [Bacteroidia bacterium]MBT8288075.1 thioredoxin family protein [Bacteroidia bacterium]NNF74495.1 thioredoxin family protein [Flavobacteriaceae bacterium]NNK71561.1 thioredoxin family protein [Flavobacteriaceae bacterium]
MKQLLALVVIAMISLTVNAQEIKWLSLEEAVVLQKKNPKKIIMDVYTVWCGPCKLLDKKTFANKDVADYINKHYYAVKFNAEGNDKVTFKNKTYTNPSFDPAKANKRNGVHELTRFFGVRAYPTMVFLDEDLEFLAPIRGYKTPQQLELYLKLFKNNDHKNLTTQEAFNEYYSTFKPEFSGE